jgi:hypothetical protein
VGSKSTIALRNNFSPGEQWEQEEAVEVRAKACIEPAAHSQAELDYLLNDFDCDDADKVPDMVLKSVSQITQLGVLAKTLAKSNRIFNSIKLAICALSHCYSLSYRSKVRISFH